MNFKCSRCKKAIKSPGALVFSPPKDDLVLKFHICQECWIILALFVQGVKFREIVGPEPIPTKNPKFSP